MYPLDINMLSDYIRRAAAARGIDPNTALTVAKSEGLQPGTWQSNVSKNGVREPSYGPFQLLAGGPGTGFPTGLGNKFQADTGLDPSDPRNVKAGIEYALNTAATSGWGQWYGAKAAGVAPMQGIQGAQPLPVQALVTANLSPDAQNFVNNNPQPGGYGPSVDDPNAKPVWGAAAPSPASSYQPSTFGGAISNFFNGTPQEAAAVGSTASDKTQKSPIAKFFDALKDFPAGPQAKSQLPMPSATNGDDLLKFMSDPNPFTDFLLKQRLRGPG